MACSRHHWKLFPAHYCMIQVHVLWGLWSKDMKIEWQYVQTTCRTWRACNTAQHSAGPEFWSTWKLAMSCRRMMMVTWPEHSFLILLCSFWSIWEWQFELTMSKYDLKSRNSGPSTSKSIILLLADVCWFNFFGWDKVRCSHCMYTGFPVGSKWWHHFSSLNTTCCRNIWLSGQYAAYVPPILTYNAPFVCVTGLTGNMPCNIQDAVQLQAQYWHSYSVPLMGNKQSNVCPHA